MSEEQKKGPAQARPFKSRNEFVLFLAPFDGQTNQTDAEQAEGCGFRHGHASAAFRSEVRELRGLSPCATVVVVIPVTPLTPLTPLTRVGR